jgi:hypothetical protein
MTWLNQLNADPLPWLLEEDSPGVRYLALRDLMDLPPGDTQLLAARQATYREGPIAVILAAMNEAGYWSEPGSGYNPKYWSTVWSVIMLAQSGAACAQDERISRACAYLLEHTLAPGGQFTTNGAPSGTADCLQGNLCWALAALGCQDARLDQAFEWMARSVTGEGIASSDDRQAAVRYYAGKCGPDFACGANNRLPCAWGGAKIMLAFSAWPAARRTGLIENAVKRGIDFFLSTDPALADYPCGWSAKPSTNWWKFGFPVFYVTDILQIVEALVGLGCGGDPRLANALNLVLQKQDSQGRWLLEYDYNGKTWVDFGVKKQPNKWVTLRAVRALKALA